MSDEHKWFYLGSDDVPQGPVAREQLLELVQSGLARHDALVWRDGFGGWKPYWEVEELQPGGESPAAQAALAAAKAARESAAKEAASKMSMAPAPQARPNAVAKTPLRSRKVNTQVLLGFAFATVAVVIVSGLYSYSSPVRTETPPEAVLHQAEVLEPVIEEEEAPVVQTAPVRIQNPFDAAEVFEFPAGTSEADARRSVADTLLQRAKGRTPFEKWKPPAKPVAKVTKSTNKKTTSRKTTSTSRKTAR